MPGFLQFIRPIWRQSRSRHEYLCGRNPRDFISPSAVSHLSDNEVNRVPNRFDRRTDT